MLYVSQLTVEEFQRYIVAQDGDQDYESSGFVILVFPHGMAAMSAYSHCSCYGTWESINSGADAKFDWHGTLRELIQMAIDIADPIMPGRVADSGDYNYDHLCNVYKQVLEKYPLEAMMLRKE